MCLGTWIQGCSYPCKKLCDRCDSGNLQQYISLGGIVGSILFVFIIFFLYVYKTFKFNSAILAASIVAPGMYTLRFILKEEAMTKQNSRKHNLL